MVSRGATAVLANAWWTDAEVDAALDAAQPTLVVTQVYLVDRTGASQVQGGGLCVHPTLGDASQMADVEFGPDRPSAAARVGIRAE